MNNKLMKIVGGSLLSAMLLAGCGTADQDPPPEDNNIEEPGVNDDLNNDTNLNENDDVNLDNDGDMMEDNNDPGEDLIEDELDREDNDNHDQ